MAKKKTFTSKQYAKNHYGQCPACHSHNVTAETLEADGNSAGSTVICEDCGATWTDIWELTGYIDLELPEEEESEK